MNLVEMIEEELEDLQNEEMFSSEENELQTGNQAMQALVSALDNVLMQFEQIEPRSLSETDKNLLHNYVFKAFMPAYRKLMRGGVMEFDALKQRLSALIREKFQELQEFGSGDGSQTAPTFTASVKYKDGKIEQVPLFIDPTVHTEFEPNQWASQELKSRYRTGARQIIVRDQQGNVVAQVPTQKGAVK